MSAALLRPIRVGGGEHAESARKVTWLELFFDLAFVAAVAQVGAPLASEYTLAGLGRYAFLFLLIWWAWVGHTTFSTRFDTDDVVHRVLTLTQICVVAVMAVNAKDALDSRSSAGFAAAYAVMRLVLVAQYARVRRITASQPLVTAYVRGFGCAAVCWLVSALVPAPARFWLWGMALLIDLGTPLLSTRLTAQAPPDAAHLPERFGLFTIILLGESLVAVMKGMESQETWNAFAASAAFLGITVAFLVWWWYFDGADGAAERPVRTSHEARTLLAWSAAHLPLYLGIAVTGVGIEHIIRIAPDGDLHVAETCILSAGVSVLMLSLVTIGSMRPPDAPRSASNAAPQCVVAALPLLLPAVHLDTVAIVPTLAVLCIVQLALALRHGMPRVPLTPVTDWRV